MFMKTINDIKIKSNIPITFCRMAFERQRTFRLELKVKKKTMLTKMIKLNMKYIQFK